MGFAYLLSDALTNAFLFITALGGILSLTFLWRKRRAWAIVLFLILGFPTASTAYNFASHEIKFNRLKELCEQSARERAHYQPALNVHSVYVVPSHKFDAIFGPSFFQPNVPTDLGIPEDRAKILRTPALRFDIGSQATHVLRRSDQDGYNFIETEDANGDVTRHLPDPVTSIREVIQVRTEPAPLAVSRYAVAERAFVPPDNRFLGIRGYDMVVYDLSARTVIARQIDYVFWHPSFWARAQSRHCVQEGDRLFYFREFVHKYLVPPIQPSNDLRPLRAR